MCESSHDGCDIPTWGRRPRLGAGWPLCHFERGEESRGATVDWAQHEVTGNGVLRRFDCQEVVRVDVGDGRGHRAGGRYGSSTRRRHSEVTNARIATKITASPIIAAV